MSPPPPPPSRVITSQSDTPPSTVPEEQEKEEKKENYGAKGEEKAGEDEAKEMERSGNDGAKETNRRDGRLPRIILYQQTHFFTDPKTKEQEYISLLPLIEEEPCAGNVTHVIIAAIHINEKPDKLTLNDDPPFCERNYILWKEVKVLQQAGGIKVLGMLGGAAKGSFRRLDGHPATFEAYYKHLRDFLRAAGLDGIDLDVEEGMSLAGIIRLILRLRRDFGEDFIITLAPVAAAMRGLTPDRNLSGFRYDELEKAVGPEIAWYNVQFYNNWGSIETPFGYQAIAARDVFAVDKLVLGCITNPESGAGWVPDEMLEGTLRALKERYGRSFGGVMGWEYFNSITVKEPYGWNWSWANLVASVLAREPY